jgi:hypothetical protein
VTGRDCIRIFNFNKYSGDQIKNIWMGEACAAWKGANGVLVGSRPLGKPRPCREENIKEEIA